MTRKFRIRTTLTRGIDLRYPSNRFILVACAITLIVSPIFDIASGDGLNSNTFSHAIQLALTAFLAWAIGRELDPDFTVTAYLAAPLAVVTGLIWEPPAAMALVGIMMATRVTNRTVGPPFTQLDAVVFIIGAGTIAILGHPIIGFGIALGIGLNHILPKPDRPRALIVATFALIATTIGTIIALPFDFAWQLDTRILILLFPIGVLYLHAIYRTPSPPTSVTDIRKNPLSHQRIIATQAVAFLVALATMVIFGNDGLQQLSALWAVFLSMGIRSFYQYFEG